MNKIKRSIITIIFSLSHSSLNLTLHEKCNPKSNTKNILIIFRENAIIELNRMLT